MKSLMETFNETYDEMKKLHPDMKAPPDPFVRAPTLTARDYPFVNPWPLNNVGDEMFFGYVVAVGILCIGKGDNEDGHTKYADFDYGGRFTRFELPEDISLRKQLFKILKSNFWELENVGDGFVGKVYIEKTEGGYKVSLP